MSSLVQHAEKELLAAGWFDKDGPYDGMFGPAVVKMVQAFADEGHSGMSAGIALQLFNAVASYKLLTPIKNPMDTGDFHDVSGPSGTMQGSTLQSTRLSSLFSEDSGKTWYDIDLKQPRWKRWLRKLHMPISHRAYVTFPYMPK